MLTCLHGGGQFPDRLFLFFLILLPPLAQMGCVERRLFVRTDPPGARVFLDGTFRGNAPLEVPFSAYGTRELTLRRPGSRALRRRVSLSPPWYAMPGLDLVSELLWPFEVEDRREVWIAWPERSAQALPDLAAPATLTERADEARARLEATEASRPSPSRE